MKVAGGHVHIVLRHSDLDDNPVLNKIILNLPLLIMMGNYILNLPAVFSWNTSNIITLLTSKTKLQYLNTMVLTTCVTIMYIKNTPIML